MWKATRGGEELGFVVVDFAVDFAVDCVVNVAVVVVVADVEVVEVGAALDLRS